MSKILQTVSLIYSERQERSNKYYILNIVETNSGYEVQAKYGKLGNTPRLFKKPQLSLLQAEKFYNNKLSEQIRQGYEEVDVSEIIMSDGNYYK